jgi:hypothetical protein
MLRAVWLIPSPNRSVKHQSIRRSPIKRRASFRTTSKDILPKRSRATSQGMNASVLYEQHSKGDECEQVTRSEDDASYVPSRDTSIDPEEIDAHETICVATPPEKLMRRELFMLLMEHLNVENQPNGGSNRVDYLLMHLWSNDRPDIQLQLQSQDRFLKLKSSFTQWMDFRARLYSF